MNLSDIGDKMYAGWYKAKLGALVLLTAGSLAGLINECANFKYQRINPVAWYDVNADGKPEAFILVKEGILELRTLQYFNGKDVIQEGMRSYRTKQIFPVRTGISLDKYVDDSGHYGFAFGEFDGEKGVDLKVTNVQDFPPVELQQYNNVIPDSQ